MWAREQLLNKRDILVQCNYRYVMSGVFTNSRYVPPEICRGDYCFDPRAWEASLRWRNITFNIGTMSNVKAVNYLPPEIAILSL